MSDNDSFKYRKKFTDIRIKPPADDTSRDRAKKTRVCEKDGCDLEGTHPAPKRNGKGRHHFCKKHVAEYNRSFNFFDGMTDSEAAAFARAERTGHKRTWKFGAGPMSGKHRGQAYDPKKWQGRQFFDVDDTNAAEGSLGSRRTKMQLKALKELDLEADATPAQIRAQYGKYVRRFHPDSNQGDRSSEEKLERVVAAGKLLKKAGLMNEK